MSPPFRDVLCSYACARARVGRHVDLTAMGWEQLTKAMDSTLHDDAALPLLDKAKDSFRDGLCTALCGWGQVRRHRRPTQMHSAYRWLRMPPPPPGQSGPAAPRWYMDALCDV
jgi:hypothetical protein